MYEFDILRQQVTNSIASTVLFEAKIQYMV